MCWCFKINSMHSPWKHLNDLSLGRSNIPFCLCVQKSEGCLMSKNLHSECFFRKWKDNILSNLTIFIRLPKNSVQACGTTNQTDTFFWRLNVISEIKKNPELEFGNCVISKGSNFLRTWSYSEGLDKAPYCYLSLQSSCRFFFDINWANIITKYQNSSSRK